MTAYIATATAIIVAAIALASWLLHRKITAGVYQLTTGAEANFSLLGKDLDALSRENQTIAETVHARLDHAVSQIDNAQRAIRSHVVDEIDSLETHVTTEVSKVATDLKSHASAAVHKAIGDLHGVRHEVCDLCGKLSNAWMVIEGKVICADCQIRKNS